MDPEQINQQEPPQEAPKETAAPPPAQPLVEPVPDKRISVDPIPEVVSQLPPDLQAAVKAGAPIVIIMGENCRIRSTRTYEKGVKFSRAEKVSDEEARVLKDDFNALLDTQSFMQDRIRDADKDWNKLYLENKKIKKELFAKQAQIKSFKDALKTLYNQWKD